MRINAVYFVNVIDEHLAKIAGIDFSFKDASLKAIVDKINAGNSREPATAGAYRDNLLYYAQKNNDAFAKAFLMTGDWRNDSAAYGQAQEIRNALAHGNAITQESVDLFNAAFPGYDFDVDGNFTLSPEMAAAFSLIKPRRVANNVELLPTFYALECAFCERFKRPFAVFQSIAKFVIGSALRNDYSVATRRDCQEMWKINNIRNRYAHTGRITASERAYVAKIAAKYGVEF